MGDQTHLSEFSAALAEAEYLLGHLDEAERWAAISAEAAELYPSDDHIGWRVIRAKLLAHKGDFEQAEELAQKAVEIASAGDWIVNRAILLVGLAEVLQNAGRREQATAAVREALRLDEQTGNVAAAYATRTQFANLLQPSPSGSI